MKQLPRPHFDCAALENCAGEKVVGAGTHGYYQLVIAIISRLDRGGRLKAKSAFDPPIQANYKPTAGHCRPQGDHDPPPATNPHPDHQVREKDHYIFLAFVFCSFTYSEIAKRCKCVSTGVIVSDGSGDRERWVRISQIFQRSLGWGT